MKPIKFLFMCVTLSLSLSLQQDVNAQVCPADLELTFGTPTQIGNLVGVPVILNSALPGFDVHGVNINVDVDPATGLVFDQNASTASVSYPFNAFATISTNFNRMTLSGLDLNNTYTIDFNFGPVTVFTVFFEGDPGQCYDLSFADARFVIPPIVFPLNVCDVAKQDDVGQYCFPAVTIEGNVNKVTGPPCVGSLNLGINAVNISIDDEHDPNNLVNICASQTDAFGIYDPCSTIVPGTDVRVSASKQDNVGCGLDEDDIIMIKNHILGISSLSEVWQHIAADVNQDGKITTGDQVEINKYLIYGTFCCPSWKFIPKGTYLYLQTIPPYSSQPPYYNWLIYDPDYHFPNIDNDQLQTDFYGIKNGDVNNSCTDCDEMFAGNGSSGRGGEEEAKTLTLPAQWQITEQANGDWLVSLSLLEPTDLTFFFADLQILNKRFTIGEILEQDASLGQLYNLEADRLRISQYHHSRDGYSLAEGQPLISFVVHGDELNETEILEQLTITGIRKPVNLIAVDGKKYFLDFTEKNTATTTGIGVYPNPFSQELNIVLPDSEQPAWLRIYSASGQLLYTQQLSGSQQVPAAAWPKGILFYELTTDTDTQSGKLIHR